MRGLYKGLTPPVVGQGLTNTILFGVQGVSSRYLTGPPSLLKEFKAGCIAGAGGFQAFTIKIVLIVECGGVKIIIHLIEFT